MVQPSGKIAIVTGVSRLKGIGAAICEALADAGHDIFFTYWTAYDKEMSWGIRASEPEEIRAKLAAKGVRVASMELNLTKVEAVDELLESVEAELGAPSILINNATYSTDNNYENITAASLDKHYAVNIRATTLLSSQFAKKLAGGTSGRIVHLTSGQFQGPMPGELAYATTKGAIDALTITLASELAPLGITVNAVNPGPTDTGWMTSEVKNDLLPMFPFGRIGEPGDVAKLIAFLVSEEAAWITGQIIHSEGGFRR